MKKIYLLLLLVILILSGCVGQAPVSPTPTVGNTTKPTNTAEPINSTDPVPLETAMPAGPVKLRIWAPPQFDPAAGTPAGDLLRARLDQFEKRRTGVEIEVRIKDVYGVGGLLDSLATTSAAAPLVLPDLIALPRDLLETGALKGLLYPYNDLTSLTDDQDWYDYARDLARIQNNFYGLPFAGDALALVYPTLVVDSPPVDWISALESTVTMVFPAADPQALFTLAEYQANGGAVLNENGNPFLDPEALTDVLVFYSEAEASGLMPFSLTQYQSDDQVWEAYLENRSDLVVTWVSRYLKDPLPDSAVAPIPTRDGVPYTLASGWVWALTTPPSKNQELSVELAEFLVDNNFLGKWTRMAGYLPTRSGAFEDWPDDGMQTVYRKLVLSAHLLPPADVIDILGLPLQEATVQVLKQQSDPVTVAQSAAASLVAP